MRLRNKAQKIYNLIAQCMITTIRFYMRWISPVLGERCRFYPSCSRYTVQAIEIYGIFRGGCLSVRRILKCHPLHPGGVDFVPGTDMESEYDTKSRIRSTEPQENKTST